MTPAVTRLDGPPASGRLVLAALLLALAIVAVARPPASRPKIEEATWLLTAASLAGDRDLAYGESDVARFRARGWSAETRIALGLDARERHFFDRPLPYPLLAAPFEAVAPGRGARLLNVLLLALAAGLATRHLTPLMRDRAPWLVAVAIFASALVGYALEARPESLLVAATVVAGVLAWPRPLAPPGSGTAELPEMYPEEGARARSGAPPAAASLARWLGVGFLVGVVALHHPLLLLLAVALAAGAPRSWRGGAVAALLVGAAAILVLSWLTETLWTEFAVTPKLAIAGDDLADLSSRGASPAAGADRRPVWPPATDYRLHGWNLVYLAAGRHLAVPVYFLPTVLLLSLSGTAPRRWLLAVSLLVLAGLAAFSPFDLAGGGGPGVRWLAPLYAAFWLTPARRPGRIGIAAVFVVGGLLMAPMWRGKEPAAADPAARVLARLPYETTQRAVPAAAEIVRRGARVRAVSDSVEAGGAGGELVLRAGGRAELMIAAERPVTALELAVGPEAVGEPRVSGAEVEQLVFRPDGGVTFRLKPPGGRRHPTWWSAELQHVYVVSFAMPETTVVLPFAVSVE